MKIRLDKLLLLRGLASSRQQAQTLITDGQVLVNGLPAAKAGSMCQSDSHLVIKGQGCPYVSRGGIKLAAGLDFFNINPKDYICADIGASTGGFTDCLLQHKARLVYAVDVGYGQLDWKLRNEPRVIVMERTNGRYLTTDDISTVDLAVIDASFISLKLLIPPLLPLFREKISILALIKPQFEVGKGKVGKGGVVRETRLHNQVISDIITFAEHRKLTSHGTLLSPILGPKGNQEFLLYLTSQACLKQL